MARKMNERPKRVNVSARLDVWCSGLFIPLAKTQRRIIRNSRHVQLRPRLHSAPLHAGGPGMDPRRLLACNEPSEWQRHVSGDGKRKMLLTRQMPFEPLPASVLFTPFFAWPEGCKHPAAPNRRLGRN